MRADRGLRFAQAQRLQLCFLFLLLALVALPAFGGTRLALQMRELLLDFVAHVAHAIEVLACRLDATFRFLAALLVLRDAGRFFEMVAKLLGRRFDDLADHALLDDRIAPRAKTGAEEHIGDIAPAAAHAVEEILRLPVAAHGSLDRDLVVARVLALPLAVG